METPTETYITVRLLMQGKEVGSIIGKKGDNIKTIREQSGARITISDGSTPERIVTMNGVVDNVNKAFSMICKKFEDDLQQNCNGNPLPPITLRLIVPASQCGSIIGKGGIKIKEIRESTGASIQVASEMLPGSTERAVTISGKLDSLIECFKQVALIIFESPPKGDTLPYKPRQMQPPLNAPIIFANGQAFQVQGQFAIPLPPHEVAKLMQMGAIGQPNGMMPTEAKVGLKTYGAYPPILAPIITPLPPSGHMMHNQSGAQMPQNVQPNPARSNVQTHEMSIPNDLIGCIIGRGGQKISEIRQVSGANIKIADLEEGNPDRHVCITGTFDQIQLAQFLINTRIATELGGLMVPHVNIAAM